MEVSSEWQRSHGSLNLSLNTGSGQSISLKCAIETFKYIEIMVVSKKLLLEEKGPKFGSKLFSDTCC